MTNESQAIQTAIAHGFYFTTGRCDEGREIDIEAFAPLADFESSFDADSVHFNPAVGLLEYYKTTTAIDPYAGGKALEYVGTIQISDFVGLTRAEMTSLRERFPEVVEMAGLLNAKRNSRVA